MRLLSRFKSRNSPLDQQSLQRMMSAWLHLRVTPMHIGVWETQTYCITDFDIVILTKPRALLSRLVPATWVVLTGPGTRPWSQANLKSPHESLTSHLANLAESIPSAISHQAGTVTMIKECHALLLRGRACETRLRTWVRSKRSAL